ncbi:MAG: hypothetical protein IMX01_08680 [Limnochordaceae bacterium]|nr:hypothetical protein [Limnochordaceae bacterium]
MAATSLAASLALAVVPALGVLLPATGAAETPPLPPQTVRPALLFLLPGASWQELTQPSVRAAWRWLESQATIASLTTRTGSGYDATAAYLTIGAGSRAYRVPDSAGTAWQGTEDQDGWPAMVWYRLWTGYDPGSAQIVYPGAAAIANAHTRADHPVTPGLLTAALARLGIATAVVGNADLPGEPWRPVALVGMDGQGRVRLGRVDSGLNRPDPTAAGGLHLDPDLVGATVERALRTGSTGWVVVEWSDLERLQRSRDRFLPENLTRLREKELIRAGQWLQRWWPRFQQAAGGRLLLTVTSPYPASQYAAAGELLTPLLVYPQPAGWLTSATTRWPGVVANLDIAPSLWEYITAGRAGPLTGSMGRPWRVVPVPTGTTAEASQVSQETAATKASQVTPGATTAEVSQSDLWQRAAAFARFESAVSRLRPVVLRGYVLSLLVVFVTAILFLIERAGIPVFPSVKNRPHPRWLRGCLNGAVLALAFGPMALLIVPPLYPYGSTVTFLSVWAAGLLAAASVTAATRSTLGGLLTMAGLTTAALMVDTWLGSPWMRTSLLGYDPAVGARYYGIGNEYMGVLVGASTLLWTTILDLVPGPVRRAMVGDPTAGWDHWKTWRWWWWAGEALAVLVTAVIALPFWGANFGGGLTAAAAGIVATLGIREENRRWERGTDQPDPLVSPGPVPTADTASRRGWGLTRAGWWWTVLAIAAVVVVLAVVDALRPEESRSHLGILVHQVGEGGGSALLLQTIYRKLATNLKIMRYSIWTWGFALGLVVLFLFFLRPSPGFRRLLSGRPYQARGLMAATVASLVGFAVNDSGVVAAATSLIFPASSLLLVALGCSINQNAP